jgi:hypothetical protein
MSRVLAVAQRTRAAGVALAAVASTFATHACIIADPPTDLPTLPELRPVIIRGSVVPSVSAVLGYWPDKFIVPVELGDPRSRIYYSAFVDYNSATGEGLDSAPATSDFEPGSASTNGRVRTLEVPISQPSLDSCHVVEVVVALRLTTTDPRNAHTPGEPGGDSVTWFYNPSGDPSGCPVADAGLTPIIESDAEGGLP